MVCAGGCCPDEDDGTRGRARCGASAQAAMAAELVVRGGEITPECNEGEGVPPPVDSDELAYRITNIAEHPAFDMSVSCRSRVPSILPICAIDPT